ncbi:MAG TPA: O-methyltransferase [Caulobacteraceae bacterium]|jgi:predicted O-methyltransferase YrrM|nr:O-methyltransferase [Caulobacteraceae bacterium]
MDKPETFIALDRYIDDLFAPEDSALTAALTESKAAGLPAIQISAGQGKFLYLLAKLVGAQRILELGTLGGYSTIWLARALGADGKLVSLEFEPRHAQVARANLARAGLAAKAEVIVGAALDTLPGVIAKADGPFDLVFIDADKVNYPNYFGLIIGAMRPGALILADNVIRAGAVLKPVDEAARATAAFNAMIAADQRVEAVILQQVGIKGHDGLAIVRVK